MRRSLSLIACLLVALVSAQPTGPRIPDRILLTMSDDPARTAIVTWRTAVPTRMPRAEITVNSANPSEMVALAAPAAEVTPFTIPRNQGSAVYYTVRFRGLNPSTQYAYRVGSDDGWSEWVAFTTASDKPEPFSFIYFGDAQNDVKSMWSRAIRQAFTDAPRAAFMLHAGDLVNIPDQDSEWAEWFYAGDWIHRQIPSVAVPGNHEYMRGSITPHWAPQFRFPRNGPANLAHSAYTFDYQGMRVVCLNSNQSVTEQAAFLDAALAQNPGNWAVVTFHHPIYSTATGRNNEAIRAAWEPILRKHKVALVLQGHDHTYGRRNLPTGVSQADRRSGTVYVVSVSGPKMYEVSAEARRTMEVTGAKIQLYQVINVFPDRLEYVARDITGREFDRFTLRKLPGGGQELVPPSR